MMTNVEIEKLKSGIECLVLRVSAEVNGERIFKDIDLRGNATSATHYGALMVVQALQEIDEGTTQNV